MSGAGHSTCVRLAAIMLPGPCGCVSLGRHTLHQSTAALTGTCSPVEGSPGGRLLLVVAAAAAVPPEEGGEEA
jgi:hypothetical protein